LELIGFSLFNQPITTLVKSSHLVVKLGGKLSRLIRQLLSVAEFVCCLEFTRCYVMDIGRSFYETQASFFGGLNTSGFAFAIQRTKKASG
jgi:hypothetical protein